MIRTITPIFSIIIAFVIFFFYTKPMFAEVKVLQGQTTEFNSAAKKAQELNAELSKKLTAKRSYNPQNLERLDALVPQSIDEVKILTDLSEIARSHNMLFGNISVSNSDGKSSSKGTTEPTQTVKYSDIAGTEIDFSLIGTYDQFKTFLADIEKSLVMLEITNISFSAGEGTLQQYSVTAKVFALPPIQ